MKNEAGKLHYSFSGGSLCYIYIRLALRPESITGVGEAREYPLQDTLANGVASIPTPLTYFCLVAILLIPASHKSHGRVRRIAPKVLNMPRKGSNIGLSLFLDTTIKALHGMPVLYIQICIVAT